MYGIILSPATDLAAIPTLDTNNAFPRALVVPTKTLPPESIRIASAPPSAKAIVSAAGKNIPVLVSAAGAIDGAAADPADIVAKDPVGPTGP